jgi:hypothetical protein
MAIVENPEWVQQIEEKLRHGMLPSEDPGKYVAGAVIVGAVAVGLYFLLPLLLKPK